MAVPPATRCPTCGKITPEIPLCYGAEAPWRLLGVTEVDFAERVNLTPDQCIVDGKHYFIRGHIVIPIQGRQETFAWSVWCSLSKESFLHTCERWESPSRKDDPPYFGWLCSRLPCYPNTLNLKAWVQSREVGVVPLVGLQESEHPLCLEQRVGITEARLRELAHAILHQEGGGA